MNTDVVFFFVKLKIVNKILPKLNCSYEKVSQALKTLRADPKTPASKVRR